MFTQSFHGVLGRTISLWLVIHTLSLAGWAAYGGGSGTPEDPYLIFTAAQLNAIGEQPGDWGGHFKLMADIDLSGYRQSQFHRIGTPEDGPFTGTFDGNYRTISNFQWSSEWSRYVGLFGLVEGEQASITNVTLVNPSVTTEMGAYVAALAGLVRTATITNCHVRSGTVSGDNCVGGLVGRREGGTTADCTVSATVRGSSRVGGLVGRCYWGLTERCSVTGQVTESPESECWSAGGLIGESQNGSVTNSQARCTVKASRDVGGLIGLNVESPVRSCCADGEVSGVQNVGGLIGQNGSGTISDCYSLCAVTGTISAGGLAGVNAPECDCTWATGGVIERCYAAGLVTGASGAAGLVAVNKESFVNSSFWDTQATGCDHSAGGSAATSRQMQTASTYLSAGWDFTEEKQNGTQDTWRAPAPGSYPRLAWQAAAGDINGDYNVDFRDFATLATQWRRIDSGFWSRGTFMAADGVIDFDDLGTLAHAWLATGK